jgi:hypothetical protein
MDDRMSYYPTKADLAEFAATLLVFTSDHLEIDFKAAQQELRNNHENRAAAIDGALTSRVLRSIGFNRLYGKLSASNGILYARVAA